MNLISDQPTSCYFYILAVGTLEVDMHQPVGEDTAGVDSLVVGVDSLVAGVDSLVAGVDILVVVDSLVAPVVDSLVAPVVDIRQRDSQISKIIAKTKMISDCYKSKQH